MPLSCIVLRGAGGLEAHVSLLGAAIVKLLVPGRFDEPVDVVLGYDTREAYAKNSTYFGSVAGRCANRIARGRFSLDGVSYQLVCNNGVNALHGGPTGFSFREWSLDAMLDAEGNPLPSSAADEDIAGVRLRYVSAAREEKYPGQLDATVTYLLRPDDGSGEGDAGGEEEELHPALLTRFSASTGAQTIVNLVQHSYWNLGGHDSGSVLSTHTLRLNAERYTPVDGTLIPTGELAPVADTAFDFTIAKHLGADSAEVPGGAGYDHNFVLSGENAMRAASTPPFPPSLAAELTHLGSGRRLRLWTDAPGLQLYTGGYLNAEPGKDGALYGLYAGVALESQNFPNAINEPGFPSPVLRPGERYEHTMVLQFLHV